MDQPVESWLRCWKGGSVWMLTVAAYTGAMGAGK